MENITSIDAVQSNEESIDDLINETFDMLLYRYF
jgi:hypothetical protein